MKRHVLVLVVALGTASMPSVFELDTAYAVAGCCKTRPSANASWVESHRDLNQCRDQNQGDGDNVFDERGLVWWDVRC